MAERILMIVESPNKVKSLKGMVPSNYIVMASVGHICEIKDEGLYNMGIDVNNNFKPSYVVSKDKQEVVDKLKEQVELADKVILASDPDREGEAISYFLKKFLKIPDKKYERVTFHEITKKAVLEALKSPRKIDMNLVTAAITRARLDKIVGYRLSNLARNKVGARSVGRCQSAGLKILVDRELEIKDFKPTKYFELNLNFTENNNQYTAKYVGTDNKKIERIESIDDLNDIINRCDNNKYVLRSIESKERKVNSKPPFTTSTFQQEVSSKLNMSIEEAMSCAQKLFEGIDVNGQHIGVITYIRTDSTDYAPEFVDTLKDFIVDNFGNEYYSPIKKQKKKDNVQDGHEAIRPVDLEMTPEKLSQYISDKKLINVYSIIYNRTLATSMSPALVIDTTFNIYNNDDKFSFSSHSLKFDGFKKVYGQYKDEDEELDNSFIDLKENMILKDTELKYLSKETQPPKRYSESSFINTLDKLGIGRPSTYASIVSVLTNENRGYVKCDSKRILVPTELGIKLSQFLDKCFSDIINLSYTSEMEKDLDIISQGDLDDVQFLMNFYEKLEKSIKNTGNIRKEVRYVEDRVCPECGKKLVIRQGKKGEFIGCSGYPKCTHIENLTI